MIAQENDRGIDGPLITLGLPCLILLLSAALRFYDLGAESYLYDEIITLRIARDGLHAITAEFVDTARPPLHLLLTSLWISVLGSSEFASRSLSAVAGTAAVAVVYALGRKLFSRRVALIGAFLTAVSEFQIWYAQESRYYGLLVLMTAISYYGFLRAIEKNSPFAWGSLAIVNALLFYTHSYAVFAIFAQGLFFVATWRQHKEATASWALSQVILVAVTSPGLWPTLRASLAGSLSPMSWLTEPDLRILGETLLIYVGSNYPTPATVIVAVGFLTLVTLFTWMLRLKQCEAASCQCIEQLFRGISEVRTQLLLVGSWLVCGWMLPWILSKLVEPMYLARYTIGASPALYLLMALTVTALDRFIPVAALLGMVVILVGPGLVEYYDEAIKENWREAALYVEHNLQMQDDVAVADDAFGGDAFDWYYDGPVVRLKFEGDRDDGQALATALGSFALDRNRMWLILRQYPVPDAWLYTAVWRSANLRLVEKRNFGGVLVFLFERNQSEAKGRILRSRPFPYSLPSTGHRIRPQRPCWAKDRGGRLVVDQG